MNETLVWFLYVVGGLLAFAAVKMRGWRITSATLAGATVAVAIWTAWYLLSPEEDRLPWFQVQLSLNACFSLIFASAGAAIGTYAKHRNHRD